MPSQIPKLIQWFLIATFLLGMSSCGSGDLDAVIHSRKRLLHQVDEFARKNKRFYDYAKKRLDQIEKLKQRKKPENQGIPRKWKSYITKIEYEHRALQREKNIIQDEAEVYFENLDKIIANIQTVSIRDKEKTTHQSVEATWKEIYGEVSYIVDSTLFNMLEVTFQDYHKVLLGMEMHGNADLSEKLAKELEKQLDDNYTILNTAIQKKKNLIKRMGLKTLKAENKKQKSTEKKPKENPEPSSASPF